MHRSLRHVRTSAPATSSRPLPAPPRVTTVHLFHTTTTTYDLTIDDLHTYYVVAGGTPVLVHNDCNLDIDALRADATSGRGVTKASRAYQKHMTRPITSLIRLGGKDARDVSEYLVDDLLTNPRSALQAWNHPQFGPVYDFQLPDIGARWTQTGRFIGFLEG
jgi:hypothetical protein